MCYALSLDYIGSGIPTETNNYVSLYKPHNQSTTGLMNEYPTYSQVRQILSFRNLGENWDGRNAAPVSAETISKATSLIVELYQTTMEENIAWHKPSITANTFGEVVFEWWNHNKKLTIYINDTENSYVKVWGPNIFTEMEDGSLTNENITDIITWLE